MKASRPGVLLLLKLRMAKLLLSIELTRKGKLILLVIVTWPMPQPWACWPLTNLAVGGGVADAHSSKYMIDNEQTWLPRRLMNKSIVDAGSLLIVLTDDYG